MDILTVTNLTKKFGKFTAVNNISFSLREGEILGLLGPNGAGKTTTIDILLGVTKPTSGKITIFNLPFEENRVQILKQMNFSAAYINLPWSLKVWENLYTFARLYEVDGFKEKVQKLMKEFKLYNLKDKPTDSLKEIDNTSKDFDLMRKYILKEVKTKKTSILFTSHNMAEVTEICDRVIFLNRGKIIAKDTPINLAMRIKFCRVRLFFDEKKKNAEELLRNYKYIFSLEGKEIVVETEEEKVGQLLGRLSLAKLKYSQITIEKPTLEDFFIKIAREKI